MNAAERETLQAYIVRIRRALHQIPEVGNRLPETGRLVAGELDRLGVPYVQPHPGGWIMADISGSAPGKMVALRADMDGLPIQEQTGLPFSSRHPGYMHACGHDAHMAMLLGAARLILSRREEFSGTVRLLFQPGEEIAQGARELIDDGRLADVDGVFGMHIGTLLGGQYPSGTIIVPDGCCMASFDRFSLKIRGFGCHGSSPEKGVDPILIASHVVLALQAIVSREIPAAQAAVVSLGRICGGSQYNLIPGEVELEGTTRALNQEVRKKLARRVEEISSSVAAAFGGQCQCTVCWGAPPLINNAGLSRLAACAVRERLPDIPVVTHIDNPNMGGEDFAHFLEHVPGAYLFLSTYDREKGTDIPHHNECFNVDESVLWEGSAAYASIALRFLAGEV